METTIFVGTSKNEIKVRPDGDEQAHFRDIFSFKMFRKSDPTSPSNTWTLRRGIS